MSNRIELNSKLTSILGSSNVYFQPPEDYKMAYPCIRYQLERMETRYANGVKYTVLNRYTVTVIDKDPDSDIPGKILELPFSSFDRSYRSNNLNHFVITLYF